MRYEDASNSFQGSGPNANDDSDQLPAGSKETATGNLITGEGTQYGAAGADSAAGGHITSIAGKGGEDSSFAGGKLSVAGEYGKLSVDAEGNYNYKANNNAPENVRDRFTYTLADNQGGSDTAALVIELGKTPVVIKADAQQVIPGPDGVVTLPPGVDLSDVMVVGRNLVINMPDGTQLIIVDGAIFVPQLVLDGVSVPATNVAALLIGQEPQPAAGELPPSSGGNFAVPPPPLDPGVPLGDLIPPTVRDYIPPEPQEVFDELDREPSVVIQPVDQAPSINAVDSVDERGLPTRNGGEPEGTGEGADGNPSNNSDPSEATSGTIVIDSPDGIDSVTIAGADGVPHEIVVGLVVAGEFGTLTITGIVGDDYTYSYVLNDNTSGDNTHDDFAVVLTDSDGDVATASLTINIIDDVPTARNDVDSVIEGQTLVADGNVLTGSGGGDANNTDGVADTVGADDADLTGFSQGNTNGTLGAPFAAQYGTLVLNADGSYTYTLDAEDPAVIGLGDGDTLTEVFTYTLTDGDGDVDTATLTITIIGTNEAPVIENASTAVSEEGLAPGGLPDSDGVPSDTTNSATSNGTMSVSDPDGDPVTVTLSTSGLPALTSDSVPILWALSDGGHTLTGTAGGNPIIEITIDDDGNFAVTLSGPIDHADDTVEDIRTFGVQVTVDDGSETDTATLTVTIEDDSPLASVNEEFQTPTLTVDESPIGEDEGGDNDPAGVRTATADFSGAFGTPQFGGDGPGDVAYNLSLSSDGAGSGLYALDNTDTDAGDGDGIGQGNEILLFAEADGSITGRLVDGGQVYFTISVDEATGEVTFEQSVNVWHSDDSSDDDSSFLSADPETIMLTQTVTDNDGDSDSASIDLSDDVFAVEDDGPDAGTNPQFVKPVLIVDESPLPAAGDGDNSDTDNFAGAFNGTGDPGTDGPGDVSYGFALSSEGAASGLFALDDSDNETVVDPLGQGAEILLYTNGDTIEGRVGTDVYFTISVDADTGAVTLTRNPAFNMWHDNTADHDDPEILTAAEDTILLQQTVTDADGDHETASVDLSAGVFRFEDDGPDADPDSGNVDEGDTLVVNAASGVLSNDDFGTDGQGQITGVVKGTDTSSPIVNGNVGVQIAGDFGNLTLNADGSYTYESTDGLVPPAGATDTFVYTIRDADGDTDTVTLTINLADVNKIPSANTPDEVWLDDDTRTGGNPGGPDDRSPDTQNTNAFLTGTGGDGDLDFYLTASQTMPTGFTFAFDAGAPAGTQRLIISQGGTPVIRVDLVNETGEYTVTHLAQIDHALDGNTEGEILLNNLISQINVSFVARDENGDDSTPKNLTITVDDDSPENNETTLTAPTVHEDALNNGNAVGNSEGGGQTVSASISVASLLTLVSIGADSPGTIGLNPLIEGASTGLTQLGISIVWDYVDATHVQGVLANDPSHVVFTIARNGSNYDFTLQDNIDNNPLTGAGDADTDSLSLANVFTATDSDGDTIVINAGASVNIQNDVPINNGASYNAGTVHEDVLNTAGAVGNPEGGGQVTSIQILGASLATLVTPGADSPVAISLNSIAAGSPGSIEGTATGLTQLGVSITWHVVSANQINGVLNGDPTKIIFSIVDNPGDANFTFQLLDNIDNNPLTGAGDADTDSLSLANVFTATDTDGDKVIIDAGATVNIQNDVPINNNATYAVGLVHEDALSNANADGNPEGLGQTTTIQVLGASLLTLVTPGADSPVVLALNNAAFGQPGSIEGAATGLFQGGVSITWHVVSATQVNGVLNGDPTKVIFTLNDNPGDTNFTFTLVDNIDHDNDANLLTGEGDSAVESLSLAGVFTATDTDGDKVVIDAGASIDIENDIPIAVSAGAITAGLENGGGDSASANLDAGGNNIVADNMGADGGKVIFTNASITALEGQDLKHGGTELIYRFTPDGQTLRGFVDNGDGLFGAGDTLVFTIQLQTGVGGNEYTVTMNDSIDSITTIDFNDGSYNFVGGNDPWAGFNQPLVNDSPDLLVTPFSATGVGDAINGNANSYGTTGGGGGQNVGGGEGIRLDFITDLTGNPAGSPANYDGNVGQQDHAFEGHYLVQDVSVRFGDGTGNSTVKIEAFDNTDVLGDDKVLGVGELVNITQIVINFDGEAQAFNFDPLDLDLTQTLEVGSAGGAANRSYTVKWVLDTPGVYHVEVTGILDTAVRIVTHGETKYEALELEYVGVQDSAQDWAITGVGIVTSTTDPVDFTVPISVIDGDGDTVSSGNLAIHAEALSAPLAPLSLMASASQEEQLQKSAANANTLTLATAVAAAGFVEPVAAHDSGNHNGHGEDRELGKFAAHDTADRQSVSDGGDSAAVSMLAPEASNDASAPADTSSSSSSDHNSADHSVDDGTANAAPESNDAPAADDGGSNNSAEAANPVAPTVAMVSAEALQAAAANDVGHDQKGGSVEKVVAEALHDGGSDVDAVLANLPGGNGGLQALAHMASPDVAAVSGWHMPGHGSFGGGHDMMFKMDVATHHQDAVQPVQNG